MTAETDAVRDRLKKLLAELTLYHEMVQQIETLHARLKREFVEVAQSPHADQEIRKAALAAYDSLAHGN